MFRRHYMHDSVDWLHIRSPHLWCVNYSAISCIYPNPFLTLNRITNGHHIIESALTDDWKINFNFRCSPTTTTTGLFNHIAVVLFLCERHFSRNAHGVGVLTGFTFGLTTMPTADNRHARPRNSKLASLVAKHLLTGSTFTFQRNTAATASPHVKSALRLERAESHTQTQPLHEYIIPTCNN